MIRKEMGGRVNLKWACEDMVDVDVNVDVDEHVSADEVVHVLPAPSQTGFRAVQ